MTCLYRAYIGLSYTVGKLSISAFKIRAHLFSLSAHCALIGEFTVSMLSRFGLSLSVMCTCSTGGLGYQMGNGICSSIQRESWDNIWVTNYEMPKFKCIKNEVDCRVLVLLCKFHERRSSFEEGRTANLIRIF